MATCRWNVSCFCTLRAQTTAEHQRGCLQIQDGCSLISSPRRTRPGRSTAAYTPTYTSLYGGAVTVPLDDGIVLRRWSALMREAPDELVPMAVTKRDEDGNVCCTCNSPPPAIPRPASGSRRRSSATYGEVIAGREALVRSRAMSQPRWSLTRGGARHLNADRAQLEAGVGSRHREHGPRLKAWGPRHRQRATLSRGQTAG